MPLGLVHASACGTDVEIPLPHQGAGSLQAVSDCAGYTCEEEQVSHVVVGDSWMSSDQGGLSCLFLNAVQLFLERQSIAWRLA